MWRFDVARTDVIEIINVIFIFYFVHKVKDRVESYHHYEGSILHVTLYYFPVHNWRNSFSQKCPFCAITKEKWNKSMVYLEAYEIITITEDMIKF